MTKQEQPNEWVSGFAVVYCGPDGLTQHSHYFPQNATDMNYEVETLIKNHFNAAKWKLRSELDAALAKFARSIGTYSIREGRDPNFKSVRDQVLGQAEGCAQQHEDHFRKRMQDEMELAVALKVAEITPAAEPRG